MEINKVQWRLIAKGEKLPCDSFLMRKDGTMTSMVTGAGVTVGQDAYYLPVEELMSFPKEESEDERIRKELIAEVKEQIDCIPVPDCRDKEDEKALKQLNKRLAWLEKQGSEPNWCHHNVDLSNCSEEYRKAYYDGWNNCNMQHSQCKSESDDVIKCLINGMKFYYEANKEATWGTDKWSMPVNHIIEVLEQILANSCKTCKDEQKPDDKVEPKFKVGDWVVVNDGRIGRIIECTKDFADIDLEFSCLSTSPNNIRSWTIQDARDGDVLADGNLPFIFKKIDSMMHSYAYCGISVDDGFKIESDGESGEWTWMQDIKPATKEQCDTLLKAMTDAGYTFDFEKKELKKVEQKPWSEEDEYHKRQILRILKNNGCSRTLQERTEKWIEERLKSIRPQSQWEPSDEQMNALDDVISSRDIKYDVLSELWKDLKKLMEE